MPTTLRHPISSFSGDFSDLSLGERILLLTLMPFAGLLGAVLGVLACVAFLVVIPA